jgi:hypothetical protein
LPELAELGQVYRDRPVRVVAVGTGSTERLTLLRQEHAMGLAVPEANAEWRDALEVVAFPETLIIDQQGRIAARLLGGHDLAQFSQVVEMLLVEGETGLASAVEAVDPPRHGLKARLAGWWVTRRDQPAPSAGAGSK